MLKESLWIIIRPNTYKRIGRYEDKFIIFLHYIKILKYKKTKKKKFIRVVKKFIS